MRTVAIPGSLVTSLLILAAGLSGARADDKAGIDFFEKKVRPVLVEHCYRCHSAGAKKKRGGLLMDTRAGMRKGGDTGPALVPGKPAESLLLKAVHYTDEFLRMPPKGKLPDAVVADLEKWIRMGAPDPRTGAVAGPGKGIDLEAGRKFWSFQPPRKQPLPAIKDTAWPRTDIDRFILAKLEEKRLNPVGDADRATLIRRAYFALIGLPPTPEQIDAFVNDKSPDAFAKVVDGLLASPHYGERWGRHWLDVARYADSTGGGRSLLLDDAWRYRDYVIESFNRDTPYNRFVVEQLAGDLLPHSSPEQRERQLIATAFLAIGPTNYELQDKDILEMDVIDEQLDTMGRAFLGLTIGCARCHDHKFDPIPTRDYYALAGIFSSTRTLIHSNVSRWVETPLPVGGELARRLKKHESAVAALKEKIKLAKAAARKAGQLIVKKPTPVDDLPGIVLDDSRAKKVGAWTHSQHHKHYVGDGYLHDGNAKKGGKTLTFVPEIPKEGTYEVRLAYTPGSNRDAKVPVTVLHLDGEFNGHVNQREAPPIDGHFVSLGKFRFDTSGQWYVMVSNEGTTGHVIVDAVQLLSEEDLKGTKPVRKKAASPGKGGPAAELKKLQAELKRLETRGPKRPMAMSVAEAEKINDCFICVRGNFHNRGEMVPRGFLRVATAGEAPTIPPDESGRRQLAEWVASADNPLTARVMANRVWHYLFGTGIVRTVDNFGTAGERPSHPELLDYLALRFVREGWSVKKLIRAIMLSRTYQLSSDVNAGGLHPRLALSADPENRLLWRMNRRRLDAEAIRDSLLTVSGTLDRTMGGPTVRKGTTSEYGYKFDDTRRGVYTPVFRNRLHELFEVFDFPDPNIVGGRRNVSTVPTQALYLMNSPFVMEQAQAAATAALAVPNLDDTARIERAYRTALGRRPTEREKQIALRFVARASEKEAAWARFYQALFASIDFRYVN